MPTVPKIFLYVGFFFVSPTFFKVCNGSACQYSMTGLAGLKLFQETAPELTFAMLILLFVVSYLFACLLVSGFNFLKERRMMLD